MKRKALFIGVNDYADNQIRNLSCSVRDAHSMNDIFEEIGYETKCLENPNKGDVFHAVSEMTAGLSAGDQFLFYFAGHGFTDSGQHLLFCSDDRHELLRFHRAGIPFDLLELETRMGGYDRSFLLDACQSDFFTGTRGEDATTRDLVAIGDMIPSVQDAPGSFYVLRSCSKYEHALEIESRRHGLFTLAMMDVLRQSRRSGTEVLFNDGLRELIREKMCSITRAEGMAAMQTPESDGRGAVQVLMCGTAVSPVSTKACPESDERESDAEIGWQRMIHELVSDVTVFPHVKLGDGFAPYVVADDMSAVLICFWPSQSDIDEIVSDLEKVRVELRRTEPETLQEMVMFCESGFPDNAAELRARGIRVMDKPQFVAFIIDYFSENNKPLRNGKICFVLGEYDNAFKSFEDFVKKGTADAEAQYMIGYMYDHGKGVAQDETTAASWYWKAAHQGYEKAIEVLEEKNNNEKALLLAEEDKIVAEIEEFTNKLLSENRDEDSKKTSDSDNDESENTEYDEEETRRQAKQVQQETAWTMESCLSGITVPAQQALTVKGVLSGDVRVGQNATLLCLKSCSSRNVVIEEDGKFKCSSLTGNISLLKGAQASCDGVCSGKVEIGEGGRFSCGSQFGADVRIGRGGIFTCHDSCFGNVEIGEDGEFRCKGMMCGNITNRGGKYEINGSLMGKISDGCDTDENGAKERRKKSSADESVNEDIQVRDGEKLSIQSLTGNAHVGRHSKLSITSSCYGDVEIENGGEVRCSSLTGDVAMGDDAKLTCRESCYGDIETGRRCTLSFSSITGDVHVGRESGLTCKGSCYGDVSIDERGTFRCGSLTGDVSIDKEAKLICEDSLYGDIEIGPKGSFLCKGSLTGDVVSHGGDFKVLGTFYGEMTDE